jgi:hypothetical protein
MLTRKRTVSTTPRHASRTDAQSRTEYERSELLRKLAPRPGVVQRPIRRARQ